VSGTSPVPWAAMEMGVAPATTQVTAWELRQTKWGAGWRRYVFPGILLAYLIYVLHASSAHVHGNTLVLADAITVVFAVGYLGLHLQGYDVSPRRFWIPYGAMVLLFVAELPYARATGFVLCVYLTILVVARSGARSAPLVVAYTAGSIFVPLLIPSWHDSIGTVIGDVTPLAIPIVALASFSVMQVQRGNVALAEARAEQARLAAENERFRIARDLHDLLGHSLTAITVKAGLAVRLGETDPARALKEIAEVEALARSSLADVRAAISNYGEVTLAGELTSGRELLRAAGIAADLPRAVEVLNPAVQELFGWVVREGLTNVVRHAHASSCAIRVTATSVEIVDDGIGGSNPAGNGLSGLRERVTAAGGSVHAGPLDTGGWRLAVTLAPAHVSR